MRAPSSFWLLLCLLGTGCGRFHPPKSTTYVYVISKKGFLRDRLALVSNHVADIHNGERLEVLEHDRRFYKVRTPDGKEGWLEEHSVIDGAEFDKFQALGKENRPALAMAVLRDDIYLHLTPGRKTEHLYLLPAGDKLQLLRRASVPKPLPPGTLLTPKPPRPRRAVARPPKPEKRQASGSTIWAQAPPHPERATAPDLDPDAPWMRQPMEDWWLVRDAVGKVGWVLGRGFDIEIPDEVAQYSEGRRIMGAYLLNTVYDNGEPPARHIGPEGAKRLARQAAQKKAHQPESAAPPAPPPVPRQMGQYVTVTSEYKDGLPYDWDQVRVFIWNARKHRYETAYRLRDQQGYMPVTVDRETIDKMGEEPTFTIRTTPDGVVTQDGTGSFHPRTIDVTRYRLEGGIVRRDTPLPIKPGESAAPAQEAQHTANKRLPMRRHHH